MNYYDHHIGDYAAATAHLSWDEDMAYTRLIRAYYHHEKPIPNDLKQACRLVRASTANQKKAVESVLNEFFDLQEDGWHQKRCDEVILDFQDGEPERKLKKTNEEMRLKRHRAERSRLFALLNQAGQHAAWNISINDLRALVQRFCGDCGESETQEEPLQEPPPETPETLQEPFPATAPVTPATATHTQSHKPLPNTHTQNKERVPPRAKQKISIPKNFGISDSVTAWAAKHDYGRLDEHLEAFVCKCQAKGYAYADWDAAFMGAIREDWAGLRTPKANKPLSNQTTSRRSVHDERAATIAALTGQSNQRSTMHTIDVTTSEIISDSLG